MSLQKRVSLRVLSLGEKQPMSHNSIQRMQLRISTKHQRTSERLCQTTDEAAHGKRREPQKNGGLEVKRERRTVREKKRPRQGIFALLEKRAPH
uniref:Uncharacterized protein n=1 Tax=Ascaris lumbricoides TaxID=6252 RepID=A0A0M3HS97_ASCLU